MGVTVAGATVAVVEVVAAGAVAGAAGVDIVCWDGLSVAEEQSAQPFIVVQWEYTGPQPM